MNTDFLRNISTTQQRIIIDDLQVYGIEITLDKAKANDPELFNSIATQIEKSPSFKDHLLSFDNKYQRRVQLAKKLFLKSNLLKEHPEISEDTFWQSLKAIYDKDFDSLFTQNPQLQINEVISIWFYIFYSQVAQSLILEYFDKEKDLALSLNTLLDNKLRNKIDYKEEFIKDLKIETLQSNILKNEQGAYQESLLNTIQAEYFRNICQQLILLRQKQPEITEFLEKKLKHWKKLFQNIFSMCNTLVRQPNQILNDILKHFYFNSSHTELLFQQLKGLTSLEKLTSLKDEINYSISQIQKVKTQQTDSQEILNQLFAKIPLKKTDDINISKKLIKNIITEKKSFQDLGDLLVNSLLPPILCDDVITDLKSDQIICKYFNIEKDYALKVINKSDFILENLSQNNFNNSLLNFDNNLLSNSDSNNNLIGQNLDSIEYNPSFSNLQNDFNNILSLEVQNVANSSIQASHLLEIFLEMADFNAFDDDSLQQIKSHFKNLPIQFTNIKNSLTQFSQEEINELITNLKADSRFQDAIIFEDSSPNNHQVITGKLDFDKCSQLGLSQQDISPSELPSFINTPINQSNIFEQKFEEVQQEEKNPQKLINEFLSTDNLEQLLFQIEQLDNNSFKEIISQLKSNKNLFERISITCLQRDLSQLNLSKESALDILKYGITILLENNIFKDDRTKQNCLSAYNILIEKFNTEPIYKALEMKKEMMRLWQLNLEKTKQNYMEGIVKGENNNEAIIEDIYQNCIERDEISWRDQDSILIYLSKIQVKQEYEALGYLQRFILNICAKPNRPLQRFPAIEVSRAVLNIDLFRDYPMTFEFQCELIQESLNQIEYSQRVSLYQRINNVNMGSHFTLHEQLQVKQEQNL